MLYPDTWTVKGRKNKGKTYLASDADALRPTSAELRSGQEQAKAGTKRAAWSDRGCRRCWALLHLMLQPAAKSSQLRATQCVMFGVPQYDSERSKTHRPKIRQAAWSGHGFRRWCARLHCMAQPAGMHGRDEMEAILEACRQCGEPAQSQAGRMVRSWLKRILGSSAPDVAACSRTE